MASLRDFVSNKKIKAPNQNGWWCELDFGDSGYGGNTGVELGEAYYNFKHPHINNVEELTEMEMSWEKIHNYPSPVWQQFYPVISFALDLDNTYEGAIMEIGESVWWGGDSIPSGNLGNYKLTAHLTGDGFALDEYNFETYFDNENIPVYVGFDTPAFNGFHPDYDRYWYENPLTASHQNVLNSNVFYTPYQILGDPRSSYNSVLNILTVNSSVYTEQTPCINEIDTNIPVIVWDYDYYIQNPTTVNSLMQGYNSDGDLERFSSYVSNDVCVIANSYVAPPVTEGTKQYNIYCDVYEGFWDIDEPVNEAFVEYRYLQVWVAPTLTQQDDARVSLYKARVGNELRANIKVYGDIKQIRYSTDGGNTWTTQENPQELPWEYLFYKRTDELRFLVYDKNNGGNMLLFDTEALCDDGSPWLASNYNDKNFYYPTTNNTGTVENSTLMGTTGLRSVFSKKYVVNYSDLVTIANDLFSSQGMVEDLQKGLQMLGERPIDAIQGLMYVPVDCATYFNLVTSGTVIIGGYEMQGTSAKLMTSYNGYFDVGSIEIKESFPSGDYRNAEPYCNLNIFLPFVGLESLKMNKYVGKTMSIRYYLDATTGECMACLFADGLLSDYFTGQMGVNLPITLTDYSAYASASLQALSGIATGGTNALIGTATGNVSSVAEGMTGFETSMFSLSQNSINNFKTTKGTSSSLLNHYLPNYVYVIFEIVETDETDNLLTVEGRRSNASGNVGSFTGFLQVESVKLNMSGATENEKQRVKDLLASGIYI